MSNYLEFQEIKSDYFNADGEFYGGFTGCSPVKNIMEKMNKTIEEMAEHSKRLVAQIESFDFINKEPLNLKDSEHFINLKKYIDYV